MVRLFNVATVLAAVVILALCASPAPAAKGVKKTGEHHVKGTVVSVQPGKHVGHFHLTIRVTHHKLKKGQVVVQKKATHTFTMTSNTRMHGVPLNQPALAALHTGAHVTVAAHQHHADAVTIHHKKKVAKA